MNTHTTSINMAMDEANTQIMAGWEDYNNKDYEAVQARLDMVSTFIKSAEKGLAKYKREVEMKAEPIVEPEPELEPESDSEVEATEA